jgi:hypothetical protein
MDQQHYYYMLIVGWGVTKYPINWLKKPCQTQWLYCEGDRGHGSGREMDAAGGEE